MGTAADAARDLRAVAARMADMSPILEVVGQDILAFIDDRFATATTPTASAWERLSEGTLSISPRRAGGIPLSDTARLRRSMAVNVAAASLSFGTNTVYAAAQNFGNPTNRLFGRPGWHPIPARQFLPVSADGKTLEPASFWDPVFRRIEHWLATGEVT